MQCQDYAKCRRVPSRSRLPATTYTNVTSAEDTQPVSSSFGFMWPSSLGDRVNHCTPYVCLSARPSRASDFLEIGKSWKLVILWRHSAQMSYKNHLCLALLVMSSMSLPRGECTETMSHIMVCRSANCLLCAASTDVAGIDVRCRQRPRLSVLANSCISALMTLVMVFSTSDG